MRGAAAVASTVTQHVAFRMRPTRGGSGGDSVDSDLETDGGGDANIYDDVMVAVAASMLLMVMGMMMMLMIMIR